LRSSITMLRYKILEDLICVCRFGNLSGDGPVDLVLSCVDNFEARMTINAVRFLD